MHQNTVLFWAQAEPRTEDGLVWRWCRGDRSLAPIPVEHPLLETQEVAAGNAGATVIKYFIRHILVYLGCFPDKFLSSPAGPMDNKKTRCHAIAAWILTRKH